MDPHLRIVGFEVGDPFRFEADAAAVGDEFDVAVAGGLRVAAEFDPVHRQRAGGEQQQDEERILQQIGHRDVVAPDGGVVAQVEIRQHQGDVLEGEDGSRQIEQLQGPAPSFGKPDLRQEMAEGEQTGQEHDGQQRRFAEGVTEADEQQRHERHGGEGRKQREESFHVRTVGLRTQR